MLCNTTAVSNGEILDVITLKSIFLAVMQVKRGRQASAFIHL